MSSGAAPKGPGYIDRRGNDLDLDQRCRNQRVVQGRIRLDRLDPADARAVEEVMDLGPATVRADADLAETTERMQRRNVASMIVSNPDGVLLGVVTFESNYEPSP